MKKGGGVIFLKNDKVLFVFSIFILLLSLPYPPATLLARLPHWTAGMVTVLLSEEMIPNVENILPLWCQREGLMML